MGGWMPVILLPLMMTLLMIENFVPKTAFVP